MRSSATDGTERARAALAALLFVALAACGAASDDAPRPRGIVFLLLDTVRADRLSVYDPARGTTPALAALAARGAVFEAAQSTAPWTVPSLASLWTGVPPSVHGAGIEGDPRVFDLGAIHGFDTSQGTLPIRLAELGYRPYARVANELLRLESFTEGFHQMQVGRQPAERLVGWVEDRLPQITAQPFFLYLHFMDAHVPLSPPDEDVRRFLPEGFVAEVLAPVNRSARFWGRFRKTEHLGRDFEGFRTLKAATYDAALAHLDRQIARLLASFERAGLLEDTLFVVTADHGEEFWDHWSLEHDAYEVAEKIAVGTGHGHALFQELLHVPLIVAGPGVAPGRRIAERVQLLDLGPTLLELAGAGPAPTLGMGTSLAPLLRGDEGARRPWLDGMYSEGIAHGYELRSLVDDEGFKLIRATHAEERDLLFDLASDPGETRDLLAQEPARAAELRRVLDEVAAELARQRRPRGNVIEGVDISELQELGYVQGGEADK